MCHENDQRRTTNGQHPPRALCRSSFIIHRSSFPRCSSGFTLLELLIGSVVMAMTLAALAGLTLAVADAWRAAEQPQSTRVSVSRSSNRFLEMVRSAKYLGWAGPRSDGSGSAVLLWEQDDDQVGSMQMCEIALLEFEAGPRTIVLYRVPATAANAGVLCDIGDIDEEADVAAFKKAGNVVPQLVMHDVVALDVWSRGADPAAKARPSLEYALRVASGNDKGWTYETVTLRAPSRRPVKCAGEGSCACATSGGCTCASAKSCACSGSAPCRSTSSAACCTTSSESSETEAY